MNLRNCWLTLNRACNLRCEWCYAKETQFKSSDDMSIQTAKHLIEMCVANGVKHFIIIGGEPTIHPAFFEVLEYIKENRLKATIVTNGLRFSDENFCTHFLPYKDNVHISISLKGSNDEYYKEHCGAAVFGKVVKAINYCKQFNLIYSLTYVLSAENIKSVDAFAKELRDRDINDYIAFSFCNEVIQASGSFEKAYEQEHPLMVNHIFSSKYQELDKILEGKFSLHQTLPLCMCDKGTMETMKEKKQIATSCHVHNRDGIIFDTNGSILLCNHFVGYGIGKYGVDYKDATTLAEFWDSEKMLNLHNLLTSMPSEKCKECDLQNNCGGGCCIQWFSQKFEQYQQFYNSISNNLN